MLDGIVSWPLFLTIMLIAGWVSVFHVIHTDRSPQATVGWVLALVFMSVLSVPFYWLFGARRYKGYRLSIQRAMASHHEATEEIFRPLKKHAVDDFPAFRGLKSLTLFPLTRDNRANLLIDGEAMFAALFAALEKAEDYILVQFFTIMDDAIGNRLLDLLKEKARCGVQVHVLYDLVGSRTVHRKRLHEVRRAGVKMRPFRSPRFPSKFLHFNFRNHRKICVIDGRYGFVGGLNVGDRYLGTYTPLSPWRDTHLELEGPAVAKLQAIFMADWHWTSREHLELQWNAAGAASGEAEVAIFPTGPADRRSTCSLMLLSMIREAGDRIWITTPYLIPTETLLEALETAARRGVEVRILTTECADYQVTYYAGWYFAERLREAGVHIFRLAKGFMHQKVVLIDHLFASVGTVNLDPRSLRLNFEVTALMTDPGSIDAVEKMLAADFENSVKTDLEWLQLDPLERTTARICRLFAPLL